MKLEYNIVNFDRDNEETYPEMFSQVLVYLNNNQVISCRYQMSGFLDNEIMEVLRLDCIKYWMYLPKLVEKENE